eukprot:TRINITY_DN10557_c0_g1_i1.p1 TRINITY_DN10557_c0_g1~~TRINITY_DN10557_c0_g1_i1.p1  ORF type:complete len:101 (+),score=13.13 TRINITY_DN10557_c0_g1_i1:182-484(+)
MDVAGNRKAVVVHVPYRLRKAFRKIHVRLVRELEKKFSGKEVDLFSIMGPGLHQCCKVKVSLSVKLKQLILIFNVWLCPNQRTALFIFSLLLSCRGKSVV